MNNAVYLTFQHFTLHSKMSLSKVETPLIINIFNWNRSFCVSVFIVCALFNSVDRLQQQNIVHICVPNDDCFRFSSRWWRARLQEVKRCVRSASPYICSCFLYTIYLYIYSISFQYIRVHIFQIYYLLKWICSREW